MISLPFESLSLSTETKMKGSILKEGWLLKQSMYNYIFVDPIDENNIFFNEYIILQVNT